MPPRISDDFSGEGTSLLKVEKLKSHAVTSNLSEKPSLFRRTFSEISVQCETALPTAQGMVFTKIPWLISLRFVGGIGAQELAAAALATTLCNVTGLSLSVGLSSALSTLSGQAKGELISRATNEGKERFGSNIIRKNGTDNKIDVEAIITQDTEEPITPVVFFWRGMVIQLSLVIPVALWWMTGIKDLLVQLGQVELLSTMTEDYLRVLAPGLIGYSINWTLTAWLQSIGMADVPAKASILGLALHVPINWFFIYFLNLGYIGCGIATVCFNILQPAFIIGYLCLYPHGTQRLLQSSGGTAIGRTKLTFFKEFRMAVFSLPGYKQYLSLALPGIVIISEWWASEAAIFLSGRLLPDPELAVGGMTIYQSINTFCFMFPVAFSIAASTRVGNLLGAGEAIGAAFAAKVSVVIAGTLSAILGVLLFCIPHTFFPSLFAPGAQGVILETSRTIPLLALYVFADGIQVALNGIIKGCGRQIVTVPIVVVAYWIVGLPLAYYIAFIRNEQEMFCEDSYFCGDVGLVAGMTTGTWVHMILLAAVVGMSTDWKSEARKAKARVAEKV